MRFDIMTLFPEVIFAGLHTSIIGRAIDNGLIDLAAWQIRDYTDNRQGMVDDYTYGGGAGMLMQAQPIYDCYRAVLGEDGTDAPDKGETVRDESGMSARPRTVYMTPQGRRFTQDVARELATEDRIIILCGHYEGVDERVLEEIVTDEISIGDFVLTGGELPAMILVDAVARLVPGVLHNEESAGTESFENWLLEYPQYSRPAEWRGRRVPEILLSGDHRRVQEWRLERSRERTAVKRPDMYERYLEELKKTQQETKKGARLWAGADI